MSPVNVVRRQPGRVALGALGVAVVAYGAWLLVSRQSGDQLRSAATWLVGGVLLHDVPLSAAVVVAGVVVSRLVPEPARAPVAVGGIVLGSLTLLAVPVLGRFGARPDNPTLLDRDYSAGWLVVAALVGGAVVLATAWRAVRRRRSDRRPTGAADER
jgi:hypothetical protein